MLIMLMYWVEEYIFGIKKYTEALVVASKETGLEVNAEKFQYTWSLLQIRTEDKISTQRQIMLLLKGLNR